MYTTHAPVINIYIRNNGIENEHIKDTQLGCGKEIP